MQISEQHLAAPQLFAFRGERLLHLHDQLGAAKHGVSVRHDLGARGLIISIGKTCANSRAGFDQNLVSLVGELAHRRWHNADAVLVVLDLLRHTDQHCDPLCHGGRSLPACSSVVDIIRDLLTNLRQFEELLPDEGVFSLFSKLSIFDCLFS